MADNKVIRQGLVIVLLVAALVACSQPTFTPGPVNTPPGETAITSGSAPTSVSPSPTPTPTLATATPTPIPPPTEVVLAVEVATETPQPEAPLPRPLRDRLVERVLSDAWGRIALSPERAAQWENYAVGALELEAAEILNIEVFLAQWERLEKLAEKVVIPEEARLGVRVEESASLLGEPMLIVYALDERVQEGESGERLFMTAVDESGQGVGLVLAPQIDSLDQRISPDGTTVQYIDPRGEPILAADARYLALGDPHQEQLDESLRDLYGWSEYRNRAIYPRYRYLLPGVEASFYALEENLTYNQILLLRETLELFDRPGLSAFKPAIFHDGVAYIFYESIGIASGLTYGGTGVVAVDRRDLFGNKYALASVLAHEGAHVVQGPLEGGDPCNQILRREVGDQTIPPGIYTWTAEELLNAIDESQVGAYHVSLWIMSELGLGEQQWLVDVIHTGMVNGHPVVLCGPE